MTSTYDTLYDEDLPGFLCVKSQFWDKHEFDVEVFIRRRTLEGDWIWLSCKALQWVEMNSPSSNQQYHRAIIPGGGVLVLVERLVDDIAAAQWLNRRIRVTAVIVQAAQAARLTHSSTNTESTDAKANNTDNNNDSNNPPSQMHREDSGTLLNETIEMEVLLSRLQETRNAQAVGDFSSDNLHQLLEIVTTQGRGGGGSKSSSGGGDGGATDKDQQQNQRRKNLDPSAIIESVRKGIRLDLGLTTSLQPEEVRLLTMVLTGELPVDDVAPLVWQSLQQPNMSLSDMLQWHRLRQQQPGGALDPLHPQHPQSDPGSFYGGRSNRQNISSRRRTPPETANNFPPQPLSAFLASPM